MKNGLDSITDAVVKINTGDQLCVAVRTNDHGRITALCAQHSEPLWDGAGHTALHWAALNSSTATLRLLLRLTKHQVDVRSRASEQLSQTPLHWAVVAGGVENVAALLQAGANPAARDARGYTALIHCAQYGRVDLAHLLLLADQTLIDAPDADGRTPLHWAAHGGHFGMVSYLARVVEPQPNVNCTDKSGQLPLHKACARSHVQVVRLLLLAGSALDHKDNEGKNARSVVPKQRYSSAVISELNRAEQGTMEAPPRANLRSYGLVFFYYIVLIITYWFYVRYVEWLAPRTPSYGASLRFFLLLALAMHSYATYGDAGDLEPGTPKSCKRDIERALASKQGDTALGPTKYCFTCLRIRPVRSRHSKSRDVCVLRFDHECPWTNNAVGLYNHRALLLFALSMFITQALFLDQLRAALLSDKSVRNVWDALTKRPTGVGLFVLHAALATFCVVLLVQHAILASKGLTTYEQMVFKRLGYARNPYDKGCVRNCLEFVTGSGVGTELESRKRQDNGNRNSSVTGVEEQRILVDEESV